MNTPESQASNEHPSSDATQSPPSAASTTTTTTASLERLSVPSACVACRSKHLKCDGLQPCTRCCQNDFRCFYVQSRRGYKGPRRKTAGQRTPATQQAPVATPESCPMLGAFAHSVASNASSVPDHGSRAQVWPLTPPVETGVASSFSTTPSFVHDLSPLSPMDHDALYLESFFTNFFSAHPFVLPRVGFVELARTHPLPHLEAAMRFIGSLYIDPKASATLADQARQLLYAPECPQDISRVQGLLLLCIGTDGLTMQEQALETLQHTITLAMQLGMHTRDFASDNGHGSVVHEESCRRTWWEVYLVDGLIAGTHQKSMFPTKDLPCEVGLPCEESEYLSGAIPSCHYMADFDDKTFDERHIVYSSYTYRIAAIRNLGRFLSAKQEMLPAASIVDKIDMHLVNWVLHLPAEKHQIVASDGHCDEMLFQAHMITSATGIVLHRDLSELDTTVAKSVTSCAPHHSVVAGTSWNIHAAKTIQAAQQISKLITLPVSVTRHTHFFTCVITLSAVVHLSVWSAMMSMIHDDDLKQQLRLNIGGLKAISDIWPSSTKAFGQVRGVAQEIFRAKKLAVDQGFWAGGHVAEEDVTRYMLADQEVMEEMQLL